MSDKMIQSGIITDQAARIAALDPARSCIVQAPAGAGKTAILIRRYLRLLTQVKEPEEIVAITFTRKAAAEMRKRILNALKSAAEPPPQDPFARELWDIATQALTQDQTQGWHLRLNPNRMRIMTIDALTARLVRMMPLLSGTGGVMSPTDDSDELYREAARATLLAVNETVIWQPQAAALLAHLDNNFQRGEDLLSAMLNKRDQWLPLLHVSSRQNDQQDGRELLESTLRSLVTESLQLLLDADHQHLLAEAISAAQFSLNHLEESKETIAWQCFATDSSALQATVQDLPRWRALAAFLLTKTGTLRKTINKTLGYPANYKDEKAKLLALLNAISLNPRLHDALLLIPSLPTTEYSADDWRLLQLLVDLLKIAVAQLQVIFAERGQVDHIEITQAALTALGDDDQPTDLALLLDHQISHLLIDEFQDTSQTHFALLKKLTAGWQEDDGKTLFCVGDPMQSIYRFREAEVGLFLTVIRQGLGQMPLDFLQLAVNFRSNATIIDWINSHFSRCFPSQNDSAIGAVSYAAADAFKASGPQAEVQLTALDTSCFATEATHITALVQQNLQLYPDDSIAILVRSRSHLRAILPALREAGITFHALDSEKLTDLPVIRDLHALVRALHHLGDRVAWFSILRAPWCGLLLADLTVLAEVLPQGPLWPGISQVSECALSVDGQQRLATFVTSMQVAFGQSGYRQLRQRVESLWLQLGGLDLINNARDLLAVRVFFDLLDTLDHAGRLRSLEQLERGLEKLFAPTDPAASRVQVLTIHKAKGLEFDSVILPGLGRQPRASDKELLQMLRFTDNQGAERLLMTTLEASGEESGSISRFIRMLDDKREQHERQRLLYVATTRAKQRLYLLGHANWSAKHDIPKPHKQSLLQELWPAIGEEFQHLLPERPTEVRLQTSAAVFTAPPLRRLPVHHNSNKPQTKPTIHTNQQQEEMQAQPDFLWAGMLARHIGTVVHAVLQQIAEEGLDHWPLDRLGDKKPLFKNQLQVIGVTQEDLQQALEAVVTAVRTTLTDTRGRWLLSAHRYAKCEYALTLKDPQLGLKHLVIDRFLVDETGQSWIIDYKTGTHQDEATLDAFLASEGERYQPQLHQYWHAIEALDGRHARLALYFPLLGIWQEIAAPL